MRKNHHLTPNPSPKERVVLSLFGRDIPLLSPTGMDIPLLSPFGGGRGRSFLPSCFIAALTRKQRTTRDVIAGVPPITNSRIAYKNAERVQ